MKSLSLELQIKDPYALRLLEFGLDDATFSHEVAAGAFDPSITQREYRDALQAMQKALLKIQHGKGTLEAAQKTINRAVLEIPEPYRHAMDTKTPHLLHLPPLDLEKSNFEVLALRLTTTPEPERSQIGEALTAALDDSLANLNRPGRGGARRDAQKYTTGIIKLAEWFSDALPDRAIYAGDNSLFKDYVRFWLQNYVGLKVSDPERHIEYALLKISL